MRIDAFPMNDELDLLELRLGELDSVIDVFVLVETGLTYRGIPKPLYYQENKHLFQKWNHKIVAVNSHTPKMRAWHFEVEQRNVLSDVVKGISNSLEDTIVFSDCDEIPNPEIVKNYTPELGQRNLKQYTYYYNFNCLMNYGRREWSRARIGTVKDFLHWGPYEFRQGPHDLDHSFPSLEDGGWHGSYFNVTLDRLRRKVHSISHDDMDHSVDSVSDSALLDTILKKQDLFHRSGIGEGSSVDIPDPKKHPLYFQKNVERFRMFTEQHFRDMVGKVSTQNHHEYSAHPTGRLHRRRRA
jgi:beta-1,4-mannosyl-glycoprotein beta-1,4-N-acetylglucosaminyltransferase